MIKLPAQSDTNRYANKENVFIKDDKSKKQL